MCHLIEQEKANAFPVMLKEEALSYYKRVYSIKDTIDGICQKLVDFYTSEEQRNRVLLRWQTLKHFKAMREDPHKSEAEVLRAFDFNIFNLQDQLFANNQHDSLLRDYLLIACNIDQIQQSIG